MITSNGLHFKFDSIFELFRDFIGIALTLKKFRIFILLLLSNNAHHFLNDIQSTCEPQFVTFNYVIQLNTFKKWRHIINIM